MTKSSFRNHKNESSLAWHYFFSPYSGDSQVSKDDNDGKGSQFSNNSNVGSDLHHSMLRFHIELVGMEVCKFIFIHFLSLSHHFTMMGRWISSFSLLSSNQTFTFNNIHRKRRKINKKKREIYTISAHDDGWSTHLSGDTTAMRCYDDSEEEKIPNTLEHVYVTPTYHDSEIRS